jgi:hypothetical protein
MSFELESLALKETTEVELLHPVSGEVLIDSEGNKVTISLYGTSSKQYRNAITAMQSRALKRGKKQLSVEEMRKEGVELLVACSDKINSLTYKGAPVDNDSAFRELYADPKFSWLREQVDAAVGDVSSFLGQ